jgi:uncharacterized membrane protein
MTVMAKSVAFSVGYMLTGSVTIVEPLCNTVAHYFFDKWWTRREHQRAVAEGPVAASSALSQRMAA